MGPEGQQEQVFNYLLTSAKSMLAEYTTSRLNLRKSVDVLIGKADLFIDRPTQPEAQRLITNAVNPNALLVFSNRDLLRAQHFECSEHLPQTELLHLRDISIDWKQTRNHVATFYYCLEELHSGIYPVRVWAQAVTQAEHAGQLDLSKEKRKQIQYDFDLQTRRLNYFIAEATAKIEKMRLRTKDNGFLRDLCSFCIRDIA